MNNIDLLDEDNKISGQNYVCLSFISPEKIIKDKNIYFFNQFLEQYEKNKVFNKFDAFIKFISYKFKIDEDVLIKDYKEFISEEKENFKFTLYDEYKTYYDLNEEQLESEYLKNNNFQTTVRGLKVRGSFPSQEEAEIRCKMLRELDPNHDVYVGPVGVWMPWDPEPYKTGKVEYMESELNNLMNEKVNNEKFAKDQFEKRLKESKRKAIEENIEKAKMSGNVLSQTIDNNDELVNIKDVNTTENILLGTNDKHITVNDVRKELFEGDNIVIDKNTDHGLSEVLKNQEI